MSTYIYHILRDERGVKMTTALREFLGDEIGLSDCLEITTTREAVALVVESLFEVAPELRIDMPLAEIANRQIQAMMTHDVAGTAPVDFEPTAVVDSLRTCEECGALYSPTTARSRFCSNACSVKAAKQRAAGKRNNGNGHTPAVEPAPQAAPEPDPLPADVIANQTVRWLIASSGVELESVTQLLSRGKLSVGERLHHRTKGWWEVYEQPEGGINVRKIEGA